MRPRKGSIDKSKLKFGEPRRFRSKAHLRFVASHPCLICGRQPSDPHHLKFAQPQALGRKVSDELRFRCVALTTANCTGPATNRLGGQRQPSIPSRLRTPCGPSHACRHRGAQMKRPRRRIRRPLSSEDEKHPALGRGFGTEH